ncbi:MAG: glycosyltransferase [Coriobacteriia bacterium]|nr:glycosyltransferase [Coriobacteriia bacterium]
MEPLLTIAVPAYNAVDCLGRCLFSLLGGLSQTELGRLEVLVVDDGSTDATAALAAAFAVRYPDAVRVISKANGGHGSVINLAAAEAQGRYFKVVDADDWLANGSLPNFLQLLADVQADAVLTAFSTIDARDDYRQEFKLDRPRPKKHGEKSPGLLVPGQYVSLSELMRHYDQAAPLLNFHGICYRTECYRQSGAVLPEHISYEDHAYATLPFLAVQSIMPLDLILYQYLVGQSGQSVSTENKLKSLADLEAVYNCIHMALVGHPHIEAARKGFFQHQLAELLLDYYTICLIKNPDRQVGRRKAKQMHDHIRRTDPPVAELIDERYHNLCRLSQAGINAATLDRLKHSRFYSYLKRLMR